MLVAPVLEPGATNGTIYLPPGVWWDYWKNVRLEGGSAVTREVDLETMPLYVKAGAIVPVGPVKQYTGETSHEPIMLRVYTEAGGTMMLYDDDGHNFDYQKGAFSRVRCDWADDSRMLSLKRDAKGKRWGMMILLWRLQEWKGASASPCREAVLRLNYDL